MVTWAGVVWGTQRVIDQLDRSKTAKNVTDGVQAFLENQWKFYELINFPIKFKWPIAELDYGLFTQLENYNELLTVVKLILQKALVNPTKHLWLLDVNSLCLVDKKLQSKWERKSEMSKKKKTTTTTHLIVFVIILTISLLQTLNWCEVYFTAN